MDEILLERVERISRADCFPNVDVGIKKVVELADNGVEASGLFWIDTIDKKDLKSIPDGCDGIGNIHRINDIPRVNKFFEAANETLKKGDYFLVCVEAKEERRVRILNKYPKVFSYPYSVADFIVKRAFPKWTFTKKIYFGLTKGKNRVISLTEALGRLVSCGFEIKGFKRIGYLTYIITKKKATPAYDMQPTYGMLVRLKRVGKGGELFDVYKFRTMYPYSEYLQDFAFERNSLQNGGKIKDDFRITGWGRWFRKLWVDELPMFINFFKGQMKLVGVRPLSRHYFSLYPEAIQKLRTQVKPGLVPPFYADLPDTLDEIIESEKVYLEAYLKNPILTDIRYFFKAWYNIIIKKARSN